MKREEFSMRKKIIWRCQEKKFEMSFLETEFELWGLRQMIDEHDGASRSNSSPKRATLFGIWRDKTTASKNQLEIKALPKISLERLTLLLRVSILVAPKAEAATAASLIRTRICI